LINIYTVLISAVLLSIGFHFVGVYANAKKIVWIVIALLWAASINVAMSEVKPKGYEYLEKIKGQYEKVDKEIQEAYPEVSLYELLSIKKTYSKEKALANSSKH